MPLAANASSIKPKRRSNLALARRIADSGSTFDMAGEIGDREQKIANLLRDGGRFAGVERRFDFIGFLANFRDHQARLVPIETNAGGLRLQFHGTGQAGRGERNVVEKAAGQGSGTFAVGAAGLPQCRIYRGFFLGLDRRPQNLDLLG